MKKEKISFIWTLALGFLCWGIIISGTTIVVHILK